MAANNSGPAEGNAKVPRSTDPPAPRYLQLAAELRGEIQAGVFGEGDPLPTETLLCDRFAVSRFTVREALRQLQADGLIRRRRGSGTVVDTRGRALRQPLSDVAELLQYAAGSVFDFVIDRRIAAGPALAAAIGVAPGSAWIRLAGVRTIGGQAVALSQVYVHADLETHLRALAPGPETLFERLASAAGFRIARVEQDISACLAGAREAAGLGIARRAPVLKIVRAYFDATGRTVEVSVSLHPGERFTYSMHMDER